MSLIEKFAQKYSIDPKVLLSTLKSTCFRVKDAEVSNEQMVALLVVADQYSLNPFTKEIYAYPDKSKGIVPVVSIDGWVRIINEHPDYNGYDVILPEQMINPKKEGEHPPCWAWVSIKLHRKNVEYTPTLTEYFDECYKPPFKPFGKDYFIDGPWQTHPKRFLRHKALIQAARVVFGFTGIYDEDEAQRIADASVVSEVSANRTSAAAEALKARMGVTQNKERNPLNDLQTQANQNLTPAKSRESEWDDATKQVSAAQPAEDKSQREKKYTLETGVAKLRAAKTLAELEESYDAVTDDFEFSERELPIDIEANYRDLREGFEQKAGKQ